MDEQVETLRASASVPPEQVRYLQRVMGKRPKHRSYAPVDSLPRTAPVVSPQHVVRDEELFELAEPQPVRIELGRFLVEEQGWPPVFAARNVDLFASAVYRRYVAVRGHEPEWVRGWFYAGATDYLIVRDTYEEEMGALVERIAHEGGAS